MIRDDLRRILEEAVAQAQASGDLPEIASPDVMVERPSSGSHGDYASPVALKLARAARMSPMAIAGAITAKLEPPPWVAAVDVAPPGFLNFYIAPHWLAQQVEAILAAGSDFARVDVGGGRPVQVEFVSANPTGPLHVGNGRGAALGDSLARVLDKAGYQVQREYYVNDAGSQMEMFNASVYARYAQHLGAAEELPAGGYPGEYVSDIAAAIAETNGRRFLEMDPSDAKVALGRLGVEMLLDQIREDLALMDVHYDRWFREQSLYDNRKVDQALQMLSEGGHVVEREGAVWFASASLGDERDNVLVRSNGLPTYFASDVAYHYDKFIERGFDTVIDVLGADHQGHVPRMKAVVGALGVESHRLVMLIYQLVNLVRQGRPVAMGKRSGEFVTLREVLGEVGPDAARFFLVGRSPDAMMEFDLDLAKAQSDVNPVYYVQYAHARMAGILRHAEGTDFRDGDPTLLSDPSELTLIRKMLELPEIVADAALALEPHPLPHYAQELATEFHTFYDRCRVIGDDPDLTKARLKLVAACQVALATTLDLIGVGAPDQM
ncbi:MAG: arginine--tRNA ligase [Chloroflexi bacterium]|nr:arginine--tRNA ligase [Chloroflexota bacterium]